MVVGRERERGKRGGKERERRREGEDGDKERKSHQAYRNYCYSSFYQLTNSFLWQTRI